MLELELSPTISVEPHWSTEKAEWKQIPAARFHHPAERLEAVIAADLYAFSH